MSKNKGGRFLVEQQPSRSGSKAIKVILAVVLVLVLLVGLLAGSVFYIYKSGVYRDSSFLTSVVNSGLARPVVNFAASYIAGRTNSVQTPPELTAPTTVPTEPTEAVTEATTVPVTEPTIETTIPEPTEPDYGETGKVVNILLVGQDYRPDEEGRLADTIMLFTLNKESKTVTVTSFLRDSYVKLYNYPGHTCGWNRINTAYALGYAWGKEGGAMVMLNKTIQENYGIEIDGNVEVSFDAFMEVIDFLGGIEVNLEGNVLEYMNGVADVYNGLGDVYQLPHCVEGPNLLSGVMALEYVRMRHSDGGDSDIKRAERQRMVIDALLERFKSLSLMDLTSLLNTVLPMVTTNIEEEQMALYIRELLPFVFEVEFVSAQCPAEGTYWGEVVELPGGISGGVLKINFLPNKEQMAAICNG